MNNEEKYLQAFCGTFGIDAEQAKGLKYQDIDEWDSVGHMSLVAALEDAFDIMMETDDIIDINSYEKGKEILTKNYDIALRSVKGSKDRKYHLPSGLNKAIPYNYITNDNSQIGFYYSYVFCDYRPIAKKRFTILKDGKYGYVDEHDAIVIPAQYQFAYPFDEKVGLALVKQFNGGWGYIDMQGVPRTKLDYSECSECSE